MPLFTMVCTKCKREAEHLVRAKESVQCSCGNPEPMERKLPTTVSTRTLELKDPRRGKLLPKNLDRQLKKRLNEHHDKYEVAQKVEEHGMNDALKFGWVKKYKRV